MINELLTEKKNIWEGQMGALEVTITERLGGYTAAALAFVPRAKRNKFYGWVARNPGKSAALTSFAMDKYSKYQKNKRNTTRLYASDYTERKFYQQMVDNLTKAGGYRVKSAKHVSGGYEWVLVKK